MSTKVKERSASDQDTNTRQSPRETYRPTMYRDEWRFPKIVRLNHDRRAFVRERGGREGRGGEKRGEGEEGKRTEIGGGREGRSRADGRREEGRREGQAGGFRKMKSRSRGRWEIGGRGLGSEINGGAEGEGEGVSANHPSQLDRLVYFLLLF